MQTSALSIVVILLERDAKFLVLKIPLKTAEPGTRLGSAPESIYILLVNSSTTVGVVIKFLKLPCGAC